MNILDTKAGAAIGIGLTAILAIYLFKKTISDGATAAAQSINPVNKDNIFASGVNAVGEVLTGDDNFKLGG
ncbi:MAG: hypothetical protein JJV99_02240 [Colwellia sp.]|nr:hypothetical protein [Colwellia sp.]